MKSSFFSSVTQPFRSLAPIFLPPFPGLGVIVVLFFAWCFVVYPHSQIMRMNFPDPDDYMYLVQVLDWLHGHTWYDNIQQRLNPPEGVMIHFSRLAMIPMAGIILFFKLIGLGERPAAMVMALFYPLILLGGFFVVMRRAAESFMPKNWAGVTAYVALFSASLMYMFQPGHVDHHGLIILIVAAAFWCGLRMIEEPDDFKWGLAAGALLALGLTLALEMLPWIIVIAGWLGVWAAIKGGTAARQGLVFALSLYLTSILGLLSFRPPATFFALDLLTYSFAYILLTGGIAVSFAAVAVAGRTPLAIRALVGAGMAAITGAAFLYRFPDMITGPYGAMPPELTALVLDEVSEALPLTARAPSLFGLFVYLAPTFIALAASLYFVQHAKPKKRWVWGMLLALLLAAFLLTTFYQCRFGGVLGMLTVIPLANLLYEGYQWASTHLRGRKKVWAEIGFLVLVGPLCPVFLAGLVDGRQFSTGVLLFPVTGSNQDPCDTSILEHVLRDPLQLGDRPRLIANDMPLGPEFLFRTPHSALAAPFFDTTGNVDAERFFSTPYPQEAEAIADRRHIELVVACRRVPMVYLRHGDSRKDESEFNLTRPSPDFAPHFIERLLKGKGSVPAWLKQLKPTGLDNYVIYEVQADKLSSAIAKSAEKKTEPPPHK